MEPRISYVLRKSRNKLKRRITLYPGDVVFRKKAVMSYVYEIQTLEDESYAYRNRRRYEQ